MSDAILPPPPKQVKQFNAEKYVAKGFKVFPLASNSKKPLEGSNGFHDAVSDPAAAEKMFKNHHGNIGLTFPDDMFAIDLDVKNGKDGIAAMDNIAKPYGGLPKTLTATTPSGGKHLIYRKPPALRVPNAANVLADGIDFRTSDGYIAVEPSHVDGGAYRWEDQNQTIADAPEWLLEKLRLWRKPQLLVASNNTFTVPSGMRNQTLFDAAAAMHAHGFSQEVMFDALQKMNAESCIPPLDDREISAIAASAIRYAVTPKPWEIFGKYGALPDGALAHPAMRFKLLSGADLYATQMRWMVRGVLPNEGLAALYGASGSGKSFLILYMGCAVAAGAEWFGHRVIQAPVTYVCLEGEAGMGKRVKAWSLHNNKPVPDALRFITQPFDLLSDDVGELAKAVIAGGGAVGMVIIDTLNRAAPGADENSSVDMGKLIAAAKQLQSLTGGLVLLVHHTGKDTSKGLRGHSSLYAALDGAIEVTKTDNRHEWSVAKSKDDVTGNAYPFKLEILTVGADDEGEDITSCVAIPDISMDNAIRRTLPPKSGNQKIIWEALGAVLRTSCHSGKAGAPPDKPCIQLDDAISKTRGRLVCEPKRQSERTQSAISGLVARGLLEHREGWIWIV